MRRGVTRRQRQRLPEMPRRQRAFAYRVVDHAEIVMHGGFARRERLGAGEMCQRLRILSQAVERGGERKMCFALIRVDLQRLPQMRGRRPGEAHAAVKQPELQLAARVVRLEQQRVSMHQHRLFAPALRAQAAGEFMQDCGVSGLDQRGASERVVGAGVVLQVESALAHDLPVAGVVRA